MERSGKKAIVLVGLGILTAGVLIGICLCFVQTSKEKQVMSMTPPDFEGVELNGFVESKCTPRVDEDFRGIVIVSPKIIRVEEDMVFPLCGTMREGMRFLNQFYSYSAEIFVVAVNAKTHRSYVSNLIRKFITPTPDIHLDETEEDFDSIVVEKWFSVDLYRYMEDLPKEEGRYHVFAYLGERTSNVVTVELVKP